MHVPISLTSDYIHGSTVLEKLTLKWSTQNIKDNGLHTYAKGCPGIIQLLPVLISTNQKKKINVQLPIWYHFSRNPTASWWQVK